MVANCGVFLVALMLPHKKKFQTIKAKIYLPKYNFEYSYIVSPKCKIYSLIMQLKAKNEI